MPKALTDAELKFWNAVRAHRLMGMGFRRQMPIGGYIVDFACPEHQLIVEIDGSTHSDDHTIELDRLRTAELTALGWQAVRFTNDEVLHQIDEVCTHIQRITGVDRRG